MTSVVVFDYGFGNVRSMVRALANLDLDVTLTSDYRQSLEADGLVVPGVGAFAACMEGLHKVRGDRVVTDRLRLGRKGGRLCGHSSRVGHYHESVAVQFDGIPHGLGGVVRNHEISCPDSSRNYVVPASLKFVAQSAYLPGCHEMPRQHA